MAISHELAKEVLALSGEDLRHLNHMIVEKLRGQRRIENAVAAISFKRGDRVRFTNNKNGRVYEGTITQQNRTTFTIDTGVGLWRVPPTMLSKVGA